MTDTLYTYSDGGARGNPGPAACGVVLASPEGKVLYETAFCIGENTNNVAEYNGMIRALELAKERKARHLVCHADSELIIFQLQGKYRIKDARMQDLAKRVKSLASEFDAVVYRQIPREHPMIRRADKLLNQELNRAKHGGTQVAPADADPAPQQDELF